MTERRKLSLSISNPDEKSSASPTRGWKVSAVRAAALKDRARAQRRDPTEAQAALWERVKDKQCGFTITREVVMGSTIVDFACKPRWLVIEIGGTEDDAEGRLAELSDRKLTEVGVRVLRFSESEVLQGIDDVVRMIREDLDKPFYKPRIAKG